MSNMLRIMRKYHPDFQDQEDLMLHMQVSGLIANHMKGVFISACSQTEVSKTGHQSVLDDTIIGMLVDLAINGAVIECGSEDAERETQRVLQGMEARLREKITEMYEEGRRRIDAGLLPRIDGRGEKVQ